MQKPLAGMKAAILVANGFNEHEMTVFQRGMMEAGAYPKIISVENGLANGWQGAGWGHYFAVDCQLADALAADFDILIIPGGQRSLDKLKLTAHTRRFIGGFIAAHKPIMVVGDAVNLLTQTGLVNGYMVTGPEALKETTVAAGGIWSENTPVIHGNLITMQSDDAKLKEMVDTLVNFKLSQMEEDAAEQAAA